MGLCLHISETVKVIDDMAFMQGTIGVVYDSICILAFEPSGGMPFGTAHLSIGSVYHMLFMSARS